MQSANDAHANGKSIGTRFVFQINHSCQIPSILVGVGQQVFPVLGLMRALRKADSRRM
jgi:hypothetical protein